MMRLLASILAAGALLLLTCTGTGSEVEGKRFAIEGSVVYADGGPVAGAVVRMRPNGFLALIAEKFLAFDTVTDEQGFFHFDTVPADSYTIEINKEGRFGALQELEINAYDSFPIVLPTATLTPTGTIYGRINLPISDDTVRPWVAIYNVDYIEEMPLTQDFRFTGVPEGVYSLRIVPYRGSKLVIELHDVAVAGDSVTDVGTLNFNVQQFFRGCTSWECDSLAIRSILDANGLSIVAVGSVATIDSAAGRVVGLDLTGRSMVHLTKEIGSLSRLAVLDLSDNRLASLPMQMGYLQALRECRVDGNALYELPAELEYLDALETLTARSNRIYQIDGGLLSRPLAVLDLRDNRIESLPHFIDGALAVRSLYLDGNELQSLPVNIEAWYTPTTISVRNNRLCVVSETTGKWLTRYDQDWRGTQRCQ